jgi:hypothetical protein
MFDKERLHSGALQLSRPSRRPSAGQHGDAAHKRRPANCLSGISTASDDDISGKIHALCLSDRCDFIENRLYGGAVRQS